MLRLVDGWKKNVTNMLGWKSRRKIIVIESDDWGSTRMPSKEVFDVLKSKGLDVDDPYNRFDALETSDDLTALFDVLGGFKGKDGKHPVVTANYLVANPDFERIKAGNFENYYFEPLPVSLQRLPQTAGSFALVQEGRERGFFQPQFHGREHLNVALWMKALQEGHRETRLAFEQGFWGQVTDYPMARRHMYFMPAFDFRTHGESKASCTVASEGYRMFSDIFGYTSKSFIAPNFLWSEDIEKVLFEHGCVYLQGQRNQLIPVVGQPQCKKTYHYTGQHNSRGQIYLVRNALFEPSSDPGIDWVDTCLRDISNAFSWRTPAIISSHRVNFIGSIVPENRGRNLDLLDKLLHSIIKQWPDVEFMSSDNLGSIMIGNEKNVT